MNRKRRGGRGRWTRGIRAALLARIAAAATAAVAVAAGKRRGERERLEGSASASAMRHGVALDARHIESLRHAAKPLSRAPALVRVVSLFHFPSIPLVVYRAITKKPA